MYTAVLNALYISFVEYMLDRHEWVSSHDLHFLDENEVESFYMSIGHSKTLFYEMPL